MSQLQTVLFDLDGTLIDSIRLILDSYHYTLTQHNLPARSDEEWLRGVGTPLHVQFSQWHDSPEMLEAMIATYREFNLRHHDRMVTVYPGVVEAVRQIKSSGIQTGLVTSKNRQGALRGLTLVGLEALMDVMVCADEVKGSFSTIAFDVGVFSSSTTKILPPMSILILSTQRGAPGRGGGRRPRGGRPGSR